MKRILLLSTVCLALAACKPDDDDCRRSSLDQTETIMPAKFSRAGGFSARSFSSPKPSYRAPSYKPSNRTTYVPAPIIIWGDDDDC